MNILIFTKFSDQHKQAFLELNHEVIFCAMKDVSDLQLQVADIIIGNPTQEQLRKCVNLKLLQLHSAGSDTYTKEMLPKDTILCNASGTFGLAISEHIICVLLMMMKKMPQYVLNQHSHVWKNEGSIQSIYGSNILILGLGDIGSESAKRLHDLGANIYGIRSHEQKKKPSYLMDVGTLDQLSNWITKMNVVICCLPSNSLTKHVINEDVLSLMKKGSYLINVGRGSAIDIDALMNHLTSEHLGGAALDVFEEEPLPKHHPAWSDRRLLLTPHISGTWNLDISKEKFIEIALHNIEYYDNISKLKNVVDFKSGYRIYKGDGDNDE